MNIRIRIEDRSDGRRLGREKERYGVVGGKDAVGEEKIGVVAHHQHSNCKTRLLSPENFFFFFFKSLKLLLRGLTVIFASTLTFDSGKLLTLQFASQRTRDLSVSILKYWGNLVRLYFEFIKLFIINYYCSIFTRI